MYFYVVTFLAVIATGTCQEVEGSEDNGIALLFDTVGAAKSCDDLYDRGNRQNGEYEIQVNGSWLTVYCQFGDPDRNQRHYIVIQRRVENGTVNFHRNWKDYSKGFGDYSKEFWLGLETIHKITSSHRYHLLVTAQDFENNSYSGLYTSFKVGSAKINYNLTIFGYNGTLQTDSFEYNNGHEFSTYDRDHDKWSGNCANARHSGWWFRRCTYANPNGEFMGNVAGNAAAMYLFKWKRLNALRSTELKMTAARDDVTDEIVFSNQM